MERTFRGAPWVLEETDGVDKGAIHREAQLVLETGEFSSCAITYRVPVPTPIYPLAVWAARDQMPTHVHSHHELVLEYAETNGGIIIPAVALYVPAGAGSYWGEVKKYIDGIMNEGIWHGCERFQYYTLAKPMFFLRPTPDYRHVELMLQYCLLYACGMSCHAELKPFASLFRAYRPLIEKLNRRRWVFDAEPFALPDGFKGGLDRSECGSLLLALQSQMGCLAGRRCPDVPAAVHTSDAGDVRCVSVQFPGERPEPLSFPRDNRGVQFKLPGRCSAALVELHFR